MTDFMINQQGKTLTASSAIKLVKYENKVSRLVFRLDGTIPEDLRLYCAFLNPKTKKYFYEPLISSSIGNYVIIGTEITYYPARWDMLLIGIAPDSNIDATTEIDDELIVWSSFTFKKIVVIDTFLSDDAVMVTHPNIEKAMDDLIVLHDEVVQLSTAINDDSQNCEFMVTQCNSILDTITEIEQEISATNDNINNLANTFSSRYIQFMNQMEATYNQYMNDLRREREGG